MKWKIGLWMTLTTFVLGTITAPTPYASNSNPLNDASSYKIYYNPPTPKILTEMEEYDLVIVEPVFYTPKQINQIQESGTLVYGYINTMEADVWNKNFFKQLHKRDFYVEGGDRIHYPEWNSYLMDITSKHYQHVLTKEVTKQVIEKGLDGAFLDTVGNIDNEHSDKPSVLRKQRNGLEHWLSQLNSLYPDLSLIQNWGFATLEETTYPYVDGIMWEGFNFEDVVTDPWAHEQIYTIKKVQERKPLKVLTVSTRDRDQSTMYANSHGFLHFHTTKSYNKW